MCVRKVNENKQTVVVFKNASFYEEGNENQSSLLKISEDSVNLILVNVSVVHIIWFALLICLFLILYCEIMHEVIKHELMK